MKCLAGSAGEDEKDGEQVSRPPRPDESRPGRGLGWAPTAGAGRGEKAERTTLRSPPVQLCFVGGQRSWAAGQREVGGKGCSLFLLIYFEKMRETIACLLSDPVGGGNHKCRRRDAVS